MAVLDPPFPVDERRAAAPVRVPAEVMAGDGMPGGPSGEFSDPDNKTLLPICVVPETGGTPDGIIGPRGPRPRVFVLVRFDCWFMFGGGPTGPGPPEG